MPAFSRFLRYFVAVGKLGSIRRAADVLHVSASAIDRQILNVEVDLDMPLFERLPSGLRLTAAGEIMMAAGLQWQKSLVEVRARLEDLRGLKRGHVELAVIDGLAKGFIPTIVCAIKAHFPGITLGLRVLPNDEARDAVLNGDVDFGIFFEPQSLRGITVQAFVEVVLGLLTLPGHPLGEQREARFSACVGLPLVVPAEPLAVCAPIAVLEASTGVVLDRTVTSDNIAMITSLVLEGAGVGILTSIDAATEVRRGQLAFTRLADPILRPMILALCTAASRRPSYAAAMVMAAVEDGFAELGWPAVVAPSNLAAPFAPDDAAR